MQRAEPTARWLRTPPCQTARSPVLGRPHSLSPCVQRARIREVRAAQSVCRPALCTCEAFWRRSKCRCKQVVAVSGSAGYRDGRFCRADTDKHDPPGDEQAQQRWLQCKRGICSCLLQLITLRACGQCDEQNRKSAGPGPGAAAAMQWELPLSRAAAMRETPAHPSPSAHSSSAPASSPASSAQSSATAWFSSQ